MSEFPGPPLNPCERVAFRAALNSPQPAVIAKLTVGDELTIRLQTTPNTAIVAEYSGVIAGSLTGSHVSTLTNCIQNGFQYLATVVSVSGGNCIVDVSVK